MHIDRKILRVCATALLCAVIIRFLGGPSSLAEPQDLAAMALFFQTGRMVQPTPAATEPAATAPPETQPPETQPESTLPAFAPEAAATVACNDFAGNSPNLEDLLCQPLRWDLTAGSPAVLILHTHGSESYQNTEGYTETSQYRTLEEAYNVVSVGERIAQRLESAGISVLQDRTLHDYPSYNGSYANARQAMSACLAENPSVAVVLDIHRDAMVDASGAQIGYTVESDKGTAAQVMLVVGGNNADWEKNMSFATKLQATLEALCPGICRPICLRSAVFNQDLSPGAVLIEMGAAGNTRQEALLAAEYVAEALSLLAKGTQ